MAEDDWNVVDDDEWNVNEEDLQENPDDGQTDDWELSSDTDEWGNLDSDTDSSQSNNFIDTADFNTVQNESSVTESIGKFGGLKVNLSTKMIGVLIGVVAILLAVFMVATKSRVPSHTPSESQGAQVERQEDKNSAGGSSSAQAGTVTMLEVPENTVLNYSQDAYEANAVVAGKVKYLIGHQIVYCIDLNITVGGSSEVVKYYCSYSAYNAVSKGDIVTVTYNQVDDSYISVSSVAK